MLFRETALWHSCCKSRQLMKTLKDLFKHELKDLYSAESQMIEALPKLASAATHPDLKKAFEAHLEETKQQKERLSSACKILGINPGNTKCDAMAGLIEEGESMIKEDGDDQVRDAGLIASAQRVEHYEIAGYGTALHYARMLKEDEVANLLATSLEEEKDADEKLNDIAISKVNELALA